MSIDIYQWPESVLIDETTEDMNISNIRQIVKQ